MVLAFRIVLCLFVAYYLFYLVRDCVAHKEDFKQSPIHYVLYAASGFVINLLDTIGVGSMATTMAFFRLTKYCEDDELVGNGNVLCNVAVAVEAFLFLNVVKVDPLTLICMVVGTLTGGIVGAKFVTKLPVETIRKILVFALVCVAGIIFCRTMSFGPFGGVGTATALTGVKLMIGIVGVFVIGVLQNAGIGSYAPTIALVSMLGMHIGMAFPIMMCSGAMLLTPVSVAFIKAGKYTRPAAIIWIFAGALGVLVAYFFIKNLSVKMLNILLCVILLYIAVTMLMQVCKDSRAKKLGTEQQN